MANLTRAKKLIAETVLIVSIWVVLFLLLRHWTLNNSPMLDMFYEAFYMVGLIILMVLSSDKR